MKKIDFRKGTGTFLMGYMIMLLGFIVSLVCIEQMKRYNNSLETQMAAVGFRGTRCNRRSLNIYPHFLHFRLFLSLHRCNFGKSSPGARITLLVCCIFTSV